MKRIYKYATGDIVPKNATYLNTVTQTTVVRKLDNMPVPCWLVWHYYEVEVAE